MLKIQCAPVTWPIGMGSRLKGVYHLLDDEVHLYEPGRNFTRQDSTIFKGLDDPQLAAAIGDDMLEELRAELELVQGASHPFDEAAYLAGRQTPVFFGSAMVNFGVQPLLDFFVEHAPAPRPRPTTTRVVEPTEEKLTGFVFKIQANMDPKHRDRIAFMRLCSGKFESGQRLFQVAHGKEVRVADALTFMAADRGLIEEAWAGRHHRPAQPRHHRRRRHLHDGRGAAVHRHPELRAGAVPPRAPQGPAAHEAAHQGPGAALRGGHHPVLPATP